MPSEYSLSDVLDRMYQNQLSLGSVRKPKKYDFL